MVYVIETTPSGWVILRDPQSEEFHGAPCIKGRWVTTRPEHWTHDRTVYVPMNHIRTVTVFDSPEAYFEAGRNYRQAEFPKPGS